MSDVEASPRDRTRTQSSAHSGVSRARRQTAVLDRVRAMNNEEQVRKERTNTMLGDATAASLTDGPANSTPTLAKARSRKSVLPPMTALPLLTPEAADILLKAMREAVDQIDGAKNNVVILSGAEVDLLILFERFAGLIDGAMRSQAAEVVDIFGDKDRIYKARAITMDVELSPMNAKDSRLKAIKDKLDIVESYLEEYLWSVNLEPPMGEAAASTSAATAVTTASGATSVTGGLGSSFTGRQFQSRKSVKVRETLARKRRELAEQRNQSAKYRTVMWAVSWLYAHRNPEPWLTEGNPGTLPQISVKDDDGNVTIDVEEVTESEAEEEDDEVGELREAYHASPAALSTRSVDIDGVGKLASSKKKYLALSTQQVDIASAPAEDLVLLLTEDQRARFGIAADASVWGSYMDLVCVRSTGDYKHH